MERFIVEGGTIGVGVESGDGFAVVGVVTVSLVW